VILKSIPVRKATIREVAKLASVSLGTVSNVFSGIRKCNPETAERVFKAAKKLNYSPNHFARSIRGGKTFNVGILISSVFGEDNPSLQDYLIALIGGLSRRNYMGLVEIWDINSPRPPKLINCSDGIILVGMMPPSLIKLIENLQLPTATILEPLNIPNGFSVVANIQDTYERAIGHLLALRHEKIGFIIKHLDCETQLRKYEAFFAAMKTYRREVDKELIVALQDLDDRHFEDGYENSKRLLDSHPEMTAIIYSSDCLAKGGVVAIREARLKIPRDISVISIDNTEWARAYEPGITSGGRDVKLLSDMILSGLFERIDTPGKIFPPEIKTYKEDFIIRASTGSAKLR